jgi:hypothetical protein
VKKKENSKATEQNELIKFKNVILDDLYKFREEERINIKLDMKDEEQRG